MVKASKKMVKRAWKPVEKAQACSKPSLPTILSAADLQGTDIEVPGAEFQPNEERRERKCSDHGEDSTTYASSCVSDDDSLCSDNDSFWSKGNALKVETELPSKGNASKVETKLPKNAAVPDVPLAVTTGPDQNLELDKMALRTTAYVSTVMCMLSPFSFGMVVARIMERMQILPVLLSLRLIAKQRDGRVKMAFIPSIAFCLSMISPLSVGMAAARFVQCQPVTATMSILCANKGKLSSVEFVRKLVQYAAYSLTIPSMIAPQTVGGLIARLCYVFGLRRPTDIVSAASTAAAILYLAPKFDEKAEPSTRS
jgi:hypothetical protein